MRDLILRPRFALGLIAASALVLRDGVVHVLGDDRTALDRYRLSDGAALSPIPLPGLPAGEVLAKRDKPDLEALVDAGDGALVALGSGSRPNRERAFRIHNDGAVRSIDLAPLYARLRQDIADLDIEGATRHAGGLTLAHRGVGRGGASRLIRLDPRALDPACTCWTADLLQRIDTVALGDLDGVALGLTDLACDAERSLHYLAAAEATDDPWLDGRCHGSVIGRIEPDGRATTLGRLQPTVKAEGLCALDADTWLVVTDADDPAQRAMLYELR